MTSASFLRTLLVSAFLPAAMMMGGQIQSATAAPALPAAEAGAVSQVLNAVNTLSGSALRVEVARLMKDLVARGIDVAKVAADVKAGAGNKLGAVNAALADAAASAPPGSLEATQLAAAVGVAPSSSVVAGNPTPDAAPAANLATAALGGAGTNTGTGLPAIGTTNGGAGGAGGATAATTGSNAGTTTSTNSGSSGVQSASTSSIGTSRTSGGSVGTSVSPR